MSYPNFGDVITRIGDYLKYPRTLVLQVLRSAFSSEYLFTNTEGHRIENPFLYEADESGQTTRDSKLELADAWTEELETTDPRPIVVVQRGPLGFHDSSIDGFKDEDPRGLAIEYADFLRMPLTCLCFAQNDIESEELGLTVGLILRFFRGRILKKSHLHKIDSPVIGEVAVITRGSRSNLFSTPVSFSVYLPMNWVIKTTAPREARGFAVQSSFRSLR